MIEPNRHVATEPRAARAALIAIAVAFIAFVIALPLGAVVVEALRPGLGPFLAAISAPDTLSAIRLTALATLVSIPLNAIFGFAAAWLVTRFRFRGRTLLVTLIDLPVAISPVIAGMLFVLLFGTTTGIGNLLFDLDLRVLFAPPAVVIATLFVTSPYVARELIPALDAQGADEEQAAMVLGASSFTVFRRITLPKAKWALLHGLVLATARAIGEFGAVSVVSGHIRGETNTVPLAVETLYDEYRFSEAFAVATFLLTIACLTLLAKRVLEGRARAQRTHEEEPGDEPSVEVGAVERRVNEAT
ncbi:MAG: sulfate ABC transporter permease subunit CysW [Polyangiaceae bacterium]